MKKKNHRCETIIILGLLIGFINPLFSLDDKAPWRFHAAVKAGDLATVQRMVQEGLDVQNLDAGGVSGLHYAAAHGHFELVKFFLDKGLAVDLRTASESVDCAWNSNEIYYLAGSTALLIAAEQGQQEGVRLLLEQGAKAKETNQEGQTFLHAAAKGGAIPLIEYGLNLGIAIDALDKYGSSPLMRAIGESHDAAALFLLEKGADPKIPDAYDPKNPDEILENAIYKNLLQTTTWLLDHGFPLLASAEQKTNLVRAATGEEQKDIALLLGQRGFPALPVPPPPQTLGEAAKQGDLERFRQLKATFKKTPSSGWTLLHDAVNGGNIDIVKACLAMGIDINSQDEQSHTALSCAIEYEPREMVDFLLTQGAKLINSKNTTLLHLVAQKGYIDLAKRCLQAGMKINAKDIGGRTPLFCCVLGSYKDENIEMFKLLLDRGADIEARARGGHRILPLAFYSNNPLITDLLISRGASLNGANNSFIAIPLTEAVKRNDIDMVERFLAAGADINAIQQSGGSALHYAIEANNLNMIEFLCKRGATLTPHAQYPFSLLHAAVAKGSRRMIDYFLQRGLGLDLRDERGFTPIFYATNSADLLNYLIKCGADPRAKGQNDFTLFHQAVTAFRCHGIPVKENTIVLNLLLDLGLDINAQSRFDGMNPKEANVITPLFQAIHSDFRESIKLLVARGARVKGDAPEVKALLFKAVEKGDLETLKLLIAQGADPKATVIGGWTLLHEVCSIDNTERYLEEETAAPPIAAAPLNTPQQTAQTDPEAKDDSDGNRGFIAPRVKYENISLLTYLIEQGLDVNAATRQIDRPRPERDWDYDRAVGIEEADIQRMKNDSDSKMIHYPGGLTPLHEAIESDYLDSAKLLIAHGAKITGFTAEVEPLLFKATGLDMIKLLIAHGADPNQIFNGQTALQKAIENEELEVAEYFRQMTAGQKKNNHSDSPKKE